MSSNLRSAGVKKMAMFFACALAVFPMFWNGVAHAATIGVPPVTGKANQRARSAITHEIEAVVENLENANLVDSRAFLDLLKRKGMKKAPESASALAPVARQLGVDLLVLIEITRGNPATEATARVDVWRVQKLTRLKQFSASFRKLKLDSRSRRLLKDRLMEAQEAVQSGPVAPAEQQDEAAEVPPQAPKPKVKPGGRSLVAVPVEDEENASATKSGPARAPKSSEEEQAGEDGEKAALVKIVDEETPAETLEEIRRKRTATPRLHVGVETAIEWKSLSPNFYSAAGYPNFLPYLRITPFQRGDGFLHGLYFSAAWGMSVLSTKNPPDGADFPTTQRRFHAALGYSLAASLADPGIYWAGEVRWEALRFEVKDNPTFDKFNYAGPLAVTGPVFVLSEDTSLGVQVGYGLILGNPPPEGVTTSNRMLHGALELRQRFSDTFSTGLSFYHHRATGFRNGAAATDALTGAALLLEMSF